MNAEPLRIEAIPPSPGIMDFRAAMEQLERHLDNELRERGGDLEGFRQYCKECPEFSYITCWLMYTDPLHLGYRVTPYRLLYDCPWCGKTLPHREYEHCPHCRGSYSFRKPEVLELGAYI